MSADRWSWPRRLLAGAAALGILVGVVIAAAATCSVPATVAVTVVNDEPAELRLSGCVDDADDVGPALTSQVDVPKRSSEGCDVYSFGTYEGCLILNPPRAGTEGPARISALLDPRITQAACENRR